MSSTRESQPETLHCAHRFGIPESVELSRRIIERASHATTPRFLIDLQSVEQFELRTDGLRRIVALLRSAPSLHNGAVAVVAPSDLVFGMSRVWQALSELAGLRLAAFRTVPAANHWLAAPSRMNAWQRGP